MTGDIERQLKQLVAQFGEQKVLKALAPLITKCKWNDWQCVANAARRIARKSSAATHKNSIDIVYRRKARSHLRKSVGRLPQELHLTLFPQGKP
jgi:hypothetical protein